MGNPTRRCETRPLCVPMKTIIDHDRRVRVSKETPEKVKSLAPWCLVYRYRWAGEESEEEAVACHRVLTEQSHRTGSRPDIQMEEDNIRSKPERRVLFLRNGDPNKVKGSGDRLLCNSRIATRCISVPVSVYCFAFPTRSITHNSLRPSTPPHPPPSLHTASTVDEVNKTRRQRWATVSRPLKKSEQRRRSQMGSTACSKTMRGNGARSARYSCWVRYFSF